ncbi:aminotransferase class I/II-fold pyridoxal phosphate-dependent enzyme [Ruminococcus sp.]|uniref:aminotransferase class I/II-fold pyridoxal phosphate-dependent enzyme n=1 Tax=Ruminococcus sp. TaxID=41978 RepID=UPI00258CA352|nr:aminotransferase class I/II-fold pyridoxal phosphate-dependent enzyme [Ruminococcus sp.]MCR5021887.1 aminotransferase class I/II-fold pyridoxal phosphate-dependent enzyme [Ruminococcus sp.]
MRTFSKSHKLDNVCYDIRGPVMDEADRMIAAGEKILKLNIGNPAPFGFDAPHEIIGTMTDNLHNAQGYSTSKGIPQAREAILAYHRGKGVNVASIDDIYTGNGVSELITMVMQGLLDNGDEVLVPAPDYPLWTASVTLAGGTAVHYICDESSEWFPDIKDMESKITEKTKAVVIINPNNPTGAVYPREILEQIAKLAREHDLIVFSDEIYDRLLMDGVEHTSIASIDPDLFCITFNGISKSHMSAGFRAGWMVLSGKKDNVRGYIEGLNMLSSMRLCSNVQAQYVIPAALKGTGAPDKELLPGGRIYDQRECIYTLLNDIDGISAVKPKAAFYIFPRIDAKKFGITSDEQFVLDLLRTKKILLVAGGGFHWEQPDHFRIVYLPCIDQLKLSMAEMKDFLSTYRQK